MELREIKWGSIEYKAAIDLRDRTLRIPLGMSIFDDPLSEEKTYIHLAVFIEENLFVATCQFKPIDNQTVLMKQVAVEPEFQGLHVGSFMFEQAKNLLKEKGYTKIDVHARHSALGFYQKLGFIEEGEPFIEVGIKHHLMHYNIEK